uniref:THAP domain-containing protein 4 n=1 Tax=Caligus clemensi TaxID=344056 RepID=C1C1Y9_CALCM|nr:THAP domain-containing protein 4 [Caligus clemensi]
MVNYCSVMECRSGTDAVKPGRDDTPRISYHSFPRDDNLRQLWIKAICRKDYVPNQNSRICSLHFREKDFRIGRIDSNNTRSSQRGSLQRMILNKDAVPTQFHASPKLSFIKLRFKKRATSNKSSEARHTKQLKEETQVFEPSNQLKSLSEIQEKMSDAIPSGFITHSTDKKFAFLCMTYDELKGPDVKLSLVINDTLKFSAYINQKRLPASKFKHIVKSNKAVTVDSILRILASMKGFLHISEHKSSKKSN